MNVTDLPNKAKEHRKTHQNTLKKLSKNKQLDTIMSEAHDEAFEDIDCLSCANCCKTTSPIVLERDIERISKKLKMKSSQFIDQYLRRDEEGDYVFQSAPCPFLGSDNYCSIYEYRPKACAEYPMLNRKKQKPLLKLHLKNAEICPAVFNALERLKEI
jgi:hypothetical protein